MQWDRHLRGNATIFLRQKERKGEEGPHTQWGVGNGLLLVQSKVQCRGN